MTENRGGAEWWTDDEAFVREWAAARDAEPVAVDRGEETELRIERDPEEGPGRPIPWPQFFEQFREADQVLLYRGSPAAEGAGSDHPWTVIDRRAVPERIDAIEKTEMPVDVEADQLALSDTGEGEPVVFDETGPGAPDERPEARRGDPETPDDRDDPAVAPTRDKTRETGPANDLVLETVHEDRPGPDFGTDDEHVTLRNEGERPLDLSGWTVRNETGQSCRIPAGTTLDPGERLTVHTGDGEDTATDLYWGADGTVWPTDGETVIVETEADERVLEAPYKGGR